MSLKSQQRTQKDKGRTNDVSTKSNDLSPQKTLSTKENSGHSRSKNDANRVNSSGSGSTANHSQGSVRSQTLKIIAEVDETNVEETVASANAPKAFFTEVQQDQAYETIFHEITRKIPHRSASTHHVPEIILTDHEQESALPQHVSNGDIEEGITDQDTNMMYETASVASSENIPSPTPDDYDTDIESEPVSHDNHDITGRTQYREHCIQSNMIPCSYFMAHIEDKEMTLRYHQFSTDDIRAITKTLCSNLTLERLHFDGNYLQKPAAKYIGRLLIINDFITELSLAENCLGGGEGTKEICKMLISNRNLRKLSLAANKFNDADLPELVDALDQCKTLRDLDLSHNCFGEGCGKVLGTYISGNDSLESLDLSWNNIRGRSAIDIANGIKENVRLKRCSIEMNGFGPDGGQILGECIKHNGALEEFNISANRLNTDNAFAIAIGLLSNDSLHVLKIADNQINSDGALAIFLCIKANGSSNLAEIDFSHTVVTQEAVDICEDIAQSRDGKFRYLIGKTTPKILQSNSASDCYLKNNHELLNKLRTNAIKLKSLTF